VPRFNKNLIEKIRWNMTKTNGFMLFLQRNYGEAESREVEANQSLILKFMRFLTTLMAGVLLMSACSQQNIILDADDSVATRANENRIGFHKLVLTAGGELRPATEGEFKFELYMINKKGEETLLLNQNQESFFLTDAAGEVWVDFSSLKGNSNNLRVHEIFDTEEDAAKWEVLEDFSCDVEPSSGATWDGVAFAFGDGPEIINIPVIPTEEPIEGFENQSPVSLTNAGDIHVTDNKNFYYAVLSREVLEAGGEIVLDMIKPGGKKEDKGDAFVKLNEEGKIEIFVKEGKLRSQNTEFYYGVRGNNGNNKAGLTLDYPEGEGDICIYVFGHYYWN
jgi:hypothetical protein